MADKVVRNLIIQPGGSLILKPPGGTCTTDGAHKIINDGTNTLLYKLSSGVWTLVYTFGS